MNFYKNTGFMTETLAKAHKAIVVFCEHRYFGKSFPYPKEVAYDKDHNYYLTVEQAMMDYVEFIKEFRSNHTLQDRPCIVFGGSYGGMLATWLRFKYPATF